MASSLAWICMCNSSHSGVSSVGWFGVSDRPVDAFSDSVWHTDIYCINENDVKQSQLHLNSLSGSRCKEGNTREQTCLKSNRSTTVNKFNQHRNDLSRTTRQRRYHTSGFLLLNHDKKIRLFFFFISGTFHVEFLKITECVTKRAKIKMWHTSHI